MRKSCTDQTLRRTGEGLWQLNLRPSGKAGRATTYHIRVCLPGYTRQERSKEKVERRGREWQVEETARVPTRGQPHDGNIPGWQTIRRRRDGGVQRRLYGNAPDNSRDEVGEREIVNVDKAAKELWTGGRSNQPKKNQGQSPDHRPEGVKEG
jgi:hypothetical protein